MQFDWTLNIGGVIAIGMALFAVCAFVLRAKDLQAMKPLIDGIPLIQHEIQELNKAVSEVKGAMAVIPALSVKVDYQQTQATDLAARVLVLERDSRRP